MLRYNISFKRRAGATKSICGSFLDFTSFILATENNRTYTIHPQPFNFFFDCAGRGGETSKHRCEASVIDVWHANIDVFHLFPGGSRSRSLFSESNGCLRLLTFKQKILKKYARQIRPLSNESGFYIFSLFGDDIEKSKMQNCLEKNIQRSR